jgi:putative FmdB family regulatory protein
MPIYEYKCGDCGKEFEVMQRITAEPLTECEACGGKLDKLMSQSAFVLKGTGWYQTDFADKKPASTGSVTPKKEEAKPADCGSSPAASTKPGKKE